MGWWPFGKKSSARQRIDDPLRKDTRQWLSELRDVCEMNFDNPEGARREIRQMQVNWHQAFAEGILPEYNREGLESRAYRLLACADDEWMGWLDNDEFWKHPLTNLDYVLIPDSYTHLTMQTNREV